jgi:hypothetical protein
LFLLGSRSRTCCQTPAPERVSIDSSAPFVLTPTLFSVLVLVLFFVLFLFLLFLNVFFVVILVLATTFCPDPRAVFLSSAVIHLFADACKAVLNWFLLCCGRQQCQDVYIGL